MYCGLLWFYCEHTSFVQFHMFATGCMQVYRYIDLDVALPWYLTICNDSLYNWILAILLRWIFVGISLGHCGKRFCHKKFFCLIFLRWDVVRISLGLLLVCRLLDICSSKRSNLINHVMKLDRPLQPIQRCFQPPIATILFGGKMLWQSVLPQTKVR